MDGIFSIAAIVAILLVCGLAMGLPDKHHFNMRWLLVALGLVIVEDALLTSGYGLLPTLIPGSWNWQGKGLALVILLAIAAHSRFGWQRIGLTFRQRSGSLVSCLAVAAIYLLFFVALALAFPNETAGPEDFAFQLTMPGIEEELFYRGLLLFALNEAFRRRWHFLGVDWGWGALLSSTAFGLAHALGHGESGFAFDPITFGLTAIPSLLAVWLRERSGSLLLPMIVHNGGNLLPMIL